MQTSYHSGRGFAKHLNHYPVKRDKGNINYNLTPQNKIWTCMDGVTDVVEVRDAHKLRIPYENFGLQAAGSSL